MKRLLSPLKHFVGLLYPTLCEACGGPLVEGEQILCSFCRYEIPLTNFWDAKDNPATQLFWGKLELEQASSLFYFTKSSKYRELIHKLKYKGKKEIGTYLGKLYGEYLSKTPLYNTVDALVPLPLHAKRLAKRGYNQSKVIAAGMSIAMQKPMLANVLKRNIYTETQTNKSRMERWKNVADVFSVEEAEKLQSKHILLIDDILTTGATLEACANSILSVVECKVSIATLAYAVY